MPTLDVGPAHNPNEDGVGTKEGRLSAPSSRIERTEARKVSNKMESDGLKVVLRIALIRLGMSTESNQCSSHHSHLPWPLPPPLSRLPHRGPPPPKTTPRRLPGPPKVQRSSKNSRSRNIQASCDAPGQALVRGGWCADGRRHISGALVSIP